MHWEPDVGFDPGSPGLRPGPKAGAKPLRHPGIPNLHIQCNLYQKTMDFLQRVGTNNLKICVESGQPGWLSGLLQHSAQGLILETWDQVPHWASCMEPASPSACVSASFSLSLCDYHN